MSNELNNNTFFEVQAEKFYQKKVEVARGVIELGQILKETREGLNDYREFEQWLDDKRVKFGRRMANKYIRIYEEFGTTNSQVFDSVSINKLYTLASAPEEIKEEVANLKDKEEVETKIKEYEERLKQEKLVKERKTKEGRIDPTTRQKNEVIAKYHGKCDRCGLDLTKYHMCREFHHIDGNSNNTVVSNLQLLCANCHKIIQYELDKKEGKIK